MSSPTYLVSTFSTQLQHGNPAAVVLLDGPREDEWYAEVATFLNQPATAFLHPAEGGFALRWFSPTKELPLCGHGTLAATHVLYESGRAAADEPLSLTTKAGELSVRREGEVSWMVLDATPVVEAPASASVLEALGLDRAEGFGEGTDDLVVLVDSLAAVAAVRPDFETLRVLPQTRTIVTAVGGEGVDFTSRVFPPRVGVTEDQVTGTAHAALGPYWSQRLGRTRLTARQASQRGGLLELDLSHEGLVSIGGLAVTVAQGELLA